MAGKIDDDERTNPIGLFNYARSYWRAAEYLVAANLKVTHPHAPVTFLFCHAIELYLKAYLRGVGKSVADLRRIGHRVSVLANDASSNGLSLSQEHSEILAHVDEADTAIEARYIVTGFANRPTEQALAEVTGTLDKRVCEALQKRGHPVRDETFERPVQKSSDGDFESDTLRVMGCLFFADDIEERGERAISANLAMTRGMVRYHLDTLAEAKFATLGSSSYGGDHFWGLTPAGRRYVVQKGLARNAT